jgi:hypothetical protein
MEQLATDAPIRYCADYRDTHRNHGKAQSYYRHYQAPNPLQVCERLFPRHLLEIELRSINRLGELMRVQRVLNLEFLRGLRDERALERLTTVFPRVVDDELRLQFTMRQRLFKQRREARFARSPRAKERDVQRRIGSCQKVSDALCDLRVPKCVCLKLGQSVIRDQIARFKDGFCGAGRIQTGTPLKYDLGAEAGFLYQSFVFRSMIISISSIDAHTPISRPAPFWPALLVRRNSKPIDSGALRLGTTQDSSLDD